VYGSLDWVREKDIVIVGGGQSALGLAALMHEVGGRVRVLTREPVVSWNCKPDNNRGLISKLVTPEGRIGPGWRAHIAAEFPFLFRALRRQYRQKIVNTTFGPSGAWWLHDRVIGNIEVSLGSEVRHAAVENDRIVLCVATNNQESQIEASHVIAATGFKTDMSQHAFLSREIVQSMSLLDGVPELTRNFETNVRGLYVIGPASSYSFGPVMRFVYGAKHAAPRVAMHINSLYRKDVKQRTGHPVAVVERSINQSSR
jgi:thioredoxin reductase